MSRKSAQLFPSVHAEATKARNYEGAPTFKRSDEENLLNVLMLGTLEDTFYVDKTDLVDQASALFDQFRKKDPEFLAKALVYARENGFIRMAPILGLVYLSLANDKTYFHSIFQRVIRTPNDLRDFVQIVRSGQIRGMGRTVKDAVNAFLSTRMSEYWAIKYGSNSQNPSLRDIYRMTRPVLTGKAQAIARYLVKGEFDVSQLSQVSYFEALKSVETEDNAVYCIERGALPYEVVTSLAPSTKKVWTALLYQAPYMNLLMNLNNFHKYGVFDDPKNVDYAVKYLVDNVEKSKILPFRFFSAYKALNVDNNRIIEAVSEALERSFVNLPDIEGNVLIANDISGSMNCAMSNRGTTTYAEVAGIFAAALFKKAGDHSKIVSFNTQALGRTVNRMTPMLDMARMISSGGGGTDLSAPLQFMMNNRHFPVDVGIFITDSESWASYVFKHKTDKSVIEEYRRTVNPNFKAFFIQLAPYTHAIVPNNYPGCYYIYGWSEQILQYITTILNGGETQVSQVRKLVI